MKSTVENLIYAGELNQQIKEVGGCLLRSYLDIDTTLLVATINELERLAEVYDSGNLICAESTSESRASLRDLIHRSITAGNHDLSNQLEIFLEKLDPSRSHNDSSLTKQAA